MYPCPIFFETHVFHPFYQGFQCRFLVLYRSLFQFQEIYYWATSIFGPPITAATLRFQSTAYKGSCSAQHSIPTQHRQDVPSRIQMNNHLLPRSPRIARLAELKLITLPGSKRQIQNKPSNKVFRLIKSNCECTLIFKDSAK
jgi:hypothetical protein